jgi:hypothetical protein
MSHTTDFDPGVRPIGGEADAGGPLPLGCRNSSSAGAITAEIDQESAVRWRRTILPASLARESIQDRSG